MRYLLDKLMTCEEGFSNMLMHSRTSERHETFMAVGDSGDVASKNDLLLLEASLVVTIISFAKLNLYFALNSQKLNLYFTAYCTGLFARSYYSRTSK
jgi:hypothetical protein